MLMFEIECPYRPGFHCLMSMICNHRFCAYLQFGPTVTMNDVVEIARHNAEQLAENSSTMADENGLHWTKHRHVDTDSELQARDLWLQSRKRIPIDE